MYYVAGVEVMEALSNAAQLIPSYARDDYNRMGTHKSKSIRIGMFPNVFRQVPSRHPIRNELQGIGSDTSKG